MKKIVLIVSCILVKLNSCGMELNREQDHYGYENYLRPIDNSHMDRHWRNQMLRLSNQESITCPPISSAAAWNELRSVGGLSTKFVQAQAIEQKSVEVQETRSELFVDTSEWDKYINWNPEEASTLHMNEIQKNKLASKSSGSTSIDPLFSELYFGNVLQPQAESNYSREGSGLISTNSQIAGSPSAYVPQSKVAGNSPERSSCFIPVNPQIVTLPSEYASSSKVADNSPERSSCFIPVNSQSISSHLDYMPQPRTTNNSSERSSCFIPVNSQLATLHFESNSTEKSSVSSSSNVHKLNQSKQIYHKQYEKCPSFGIRSYERLSLARRLTPAFTKRGYQNVFRISSVTVSNDIAYGLALGIIKETRSQYQGIFTFTKKSFPRLSQP